MDFTIYDHLFNFYTYLLHKDLKSRFNKEKYVIFNLLVLYRESDQMSLVKKVDPREEASRKAAEEATKRALDKQMKIFIQDFVFPCTYKIFNTIVDWMGKY